MASGPDFSRVVQFDLARGTVRLETEAALLIGARSLAQLMELVPVEARARFGGELGGAMGARIEGRLGGPAAVREAPIEAVVTNLGAELALGGFGVLSLERWGRALVLHVGGAPLEAPEFYASLIASAISRATGAAAYSTVLSTSDGVRVVIASQSGAQRVRSWITQGVAWSVALTQLQGSAS